MKRKVAGTPWTVPGRMDRIPVEVQDAVELWAREHGRHGRIVWSPVTRCAVVELDLKPGDPRLEAYQQGRLRMEPKERVLLHQWNPATKRYEAVPSRPGELTPDFVREWLDRGNMWSGRGETDAKNLHDACVKADRAEREYRERRRSQIRNATRDRARERRRQVLGLPVVSVPDNVS
ncbi:MAG: hypothetical protein ACOC9H_01105 [Gemmatimonadota bacterium]